MARAFPLSAQKNQFASKGNRHILVWSSLINLILHLFVTLIFFYRLFYLPVFVE